MSTDVTILQRGAERSGHMFLKDSPQVVEWVPEADQKAIEWKDLSESGSTYTCAVRIAQEAGVFSVYAPRLPGTASQGATLEEAIENIKEALLGVIQIHEESGNPIPWLPPARDPIQQGEIERWITVHA